MNAVALGSGPSNAASCNLRFADFTVNFLFIYIIVGTSYVQADSQFLSSSSDIALDSEEETCKLDSCHTGKDMAARLVSVDFEVFGRVQGVFFRKYTMKTATQYGLVGWVMNTSHSTVKGQMQGEKRKVDDMKEWLQKTGSPKSRIEKCEFKNERTVDRKEFPSFTVRK